ncbi:TetR/AcrR family transcriptional regulator [Ahrensia marina]|uniref:TetR family transcriptional regulator n=1 Tax=Ahrensia marina TaxID=1514904 RepID=A0A0M9GMU0_9HYPH|nr:TetR/AcrR family transcriptional regulator [Ahrensia marina]KPB01146.1 TetR family transcriptional regulator [Ahrensia marina]
MKKPVQNRSKATRSRLISVATELIKKNGYEALRVEDVVTGAGVAKGTFFSHFKDKDALMELCIGTRIDAILDQVETKLKPKDVTDLVDGLLPLLNFMTCERYVFDVILRYSGAAAVEEIGAIAMTFDRQGKVLADWLADGPFRNDVSSQLLADGVQAFLIQAMALKFCALHNSQSTVEILVPYLEAWLNPKTVV